MAEGGDVANRRATLEARRDEIKHQIVRREAELKELANGLLPFATAPKLVGCLSKALRLAAEPVDAREADALRERLLAWRASETSHVLAAMLGEAAQLPSEMHGYGGDSELIGARAP